MENEIKMEMRPKVRYWLPAAAVEENDLREEIRQLCARGFGGVEVVAFDMFTPQLGEGETAWDSPRWRRALGIIAEETQRLGMTMDIANGPAWPIGSPCVQSADDPAALYELTYGETMLAAGSYTDLKLPAGKKERDEGTVKLVHAAAYRLAGEKTLDQDSYRDLMGEVRAQKEGYTLSVELPGGPNDTWMLFAFYGQPAVQKVDGGRIYVIDHFSKAGAKACEDYWDSVLNDVTGGGESVYPSMESFFCDSLEYQVTMEWTRDMPEEFEERRGYSIFPYLPYLGIAYGYPENEIAGYVCSDPLISTQSNNDYLEVVTQLFCENHLKPLETMAEKYGKTIRYQVAYNKPIEVERSALYVGIPENEALGRATLDGQRTMAAAAHLGRKKRYSFECAAEFGHTYGQDYEDLFWWAKRSLMAGMNAQVLHGASYSGAYRGPMSVNGNIPGAEWPGNNAFGLMVSNNWNRTPSIGHARGCLDALSRMNEVFRHKAKVDLAIYMDIPCNNGKGSEFYLYPDDGALSNAGYSYDFVSQALLELPVCQVGDRILDPEGVGYKALIMPEHRLVSMGYLKKLEEFMAQDFKAVWIGAKPEAGKYLGEWKTVESRKMWQALLEQVWNHPNMCHVGRPEEVPAALFGLGILPQIALDGSMDILTAVRVDEEQGIKYCALYGYNRVDYAPGNNSFDISVSADYREGTAKPTYTRPGAASCRKLRVSIESGESVAVYDPWDGNCKPVSYTKQADGSLSLELPIEEDELVILKVEEKAPKACPAEKNVSLTEGTATEIRKAVLTNAVAFDRVTFYPFGPDSEGEVSFLRSGFKDEIKTIRLSSAADLKPWKDMDEDLLRFVGKAVYEGTITLDSKKKEAAYLLTLGQVSDTFTVKINGEECSFPDQVMKRLDISRMLSAGENRVEVTVVSNLYNALYDEHTSLMGMMPLPYHPREYGMWETEGKKIRLDITLS